MDTMDSSALLRTFAPRPLAWVSSFNDDLSINIAPLSAIMLVSDSPPVVLLTVQRNKDGARKRTAQNILSRGVFVLNFPRVEQLANLMLSTSPEVANDRRSAISGLEFEVGPSLQRIKGCSRYAECRFLSAQRFPTDGADLILAQITSLAEDARGGVEGQALQRFLGALDYEWFVSECGLTRIEQPYLSLDADRSP